MSDILGNLQRFSYEAAASACGSCHQDYKGIVERVASSVEKYFDGLCLDCLDRSKSKTGSIDKDYWRHHKLTEYEVVHGCRVPHKQPTWYFSFMGRKEERDRLMKQRAADKRRNQFSRWFDQSDDSDDDEEDS